MSESSPIQPEEVTVQPVLAVQLTRESGSAPEAISQAMQEAHQVIGQAIASLQLQPAGPPRAIYHTFGPEGTRFTLAMPVAHTQSLGATEDGVSVGAIEGGRALRFTHKGPYERLAQTYEAITAWLKAKGMIESEAGWANYMPMWEEYESIPEITPPEELLTYIYLPLPAA